MNCIYRYFTRKSLDKFEFGPDKVQVRSSSSEKIRPSELFHTGSYRPAASIDPHLIIFYIELCLLNLKKEKFLIYALLTCVCVCVYIYTDFIWIWSKSDDFWQSFLPFLLLYFWKGLYNKLKLHV